MAIKVFTEISRTLLSFIKFSRGITICLTVILMMFLLGFVVSLFAPCDPRRWNYVPRDIPPSLKYPLGTTTLGQDVFWLMTHAIKNSTIVSITGSVVGLAIGAILGIIAGYKGELLEKIILLVGDVFIVLPGLPVIILFGSMVKGSLNMFTLGLIIAFLTWGWPIRNVRSMILSLREREFTYTARFSNMSTFETISKEHLPHVFPWMLASFMGRMLTSMGMKATLAIFGLASLTEATFGIILYWALQYKALTRGLWWWILSPILIIVIFFASLYVISTKVNEYLDPRNRIMRLTAGKRPQK